MTGRELRMTFVVVVVAAVVARELEVVPNTTFKTSLYKCVCVFFLMDEFFLFHLLTFFLAPVSFSPEDTTSNHPQLSPRTEGVGSGYPSEEEFQRQVRDPDSNDPSAWPVAPVPWLQAEAQQIIVSAPNVGSIGNSLFEDSWGKPLEDTGAGFWVGGFWVVRKREVLMFWKKVM